MVSSHGAPAWAIKKEVAMSTLATELSGLVAAVRSDHTTLNELSFRLRELCVSLLDGDRKCDSDPGGLIEEFESELIPHFAAEQAEEFFASLATEKPWMLKRVERLQEEHRQMADAIDPLLELARDDPGPGLALRLSNFLDSFDEHERAENALMQEFFLLDEGAGGD
jgi:hypothetical protein